MAEVVHEVVGVVFGRWSSGKTDRRWTASHVIVIRSSQPFRAECWDKRTKNEQLRTGGCSKNKHGRCSMENGRHPPRLPAGLYLSNLQAVETALKS
jgi:hypothetical protein